MSQVSTGDHAFHFPQQRITKEVGLGGTSATFLWFPSVNSDGLLKSYIKTEPGIFLNKGQMWDQVLALVEEISQSSPYSIQPTSCFYIECLREPSRESQIKQTGEPADGLAECLTYLQSHNILITVSFPHDVDVSSNSVYPFNLINVNVSLFQMSSIWSAPVLLKIQLK